MKRVVLAIFSIGLSLLSTGCSSDDATSNPAELQEAYTNNDASENKLRSLLSDKTWYCVYGNVKETVLPYVFNTDITLINEGTEAQASVELEGNRLSYPDPNTPAGNYTQFEKRYSTYLQAHVVYADGAAHEEVRFFKTQSTAQAWADSL